MNKHRTHKLHKGYVLSLGVLIFLGGIHYLNTRAGALESGAMWLIGHYLAVVCAVLFTVALLGVMLFGVGRWKQCPIETIFFVSALLFGSLYLYVLPPLSAPDEARHYASAYKLSNQIMGLPVTGEDNKVILREEDWFSEDPTGDYKPYLTKDGTLATDAEGAEEARILGQTLTQETYRLIHEKGGFQYEAPRLPEGSGVALSNHLPVVTTPLGYAAPAVGITLARLLQLNNLWLLFLGRWMNLLMFSVVTYLAMKKLPFGKEVLFGVALLPMTIHLSASFSYDVLILAGIFYFTAYCLHLAYEAEQVRTVDVLRLALVMAVVGPCKMVYTVFMGLCLLIPMKKFQSRKKWILSALGVLGAWAIAMLLINSQTIASYATPGTDNYISWAGEPGYTIGMLVHQPIRLFQLFYNTLVWQAEYWHMTGIGAYLGNTDLVLDVPYLVVVILTVCLLFLAFRKPGESLMITGGRRLWILCLCILCAGATMFSMLIAWTPISSNIIMGVQGRYFLPFLPLLLMAIKNNTVVLTKKEDRSILYLMCCANGYVLMRIYSIVSMRL